MRSAPRGQAPTEKVKRLTEGVDVRGEAVELGSSWNEWCSWQSDEGSGCPAGKPSANGTWVVEKTRWKAACTLDELHIRTGLAESYLR